MKIIAFANQKGGPGKTTGAMLVTGELVARELSALLVDSDPQGSAQKWETRSIEGYPEVPFRVEHLVGLNEQQFAAALAKRVGGAQFVVIDTPPNLDSKELHAALFVADLVVIPFVPDAAHVDALEEVAPLFEEVNSRRERVGSPPIVARLLINRHDTRRASERAVVDNAEKIAGIPRFHTSFGNRSGFQSAWNYRTTLAAIAKASTPARKEVSSLVDEILEVLSDE